jgi:2-polyprenyl-3-methyl-5-hydroxy-6-metoxy-1,4-benzoquinol methylase
VTDLHEAFSDPGREAADSMVRFLEQADRLPGIRAIQVAMRRALDMRPGMNVVDAGCGNGLEATRLASEHPGVRVTGLDRNADLLDAARRRPGARRPNLDWLHADLAGADLPKGRFDAARTERVLLHIPDAELDGALDGLVKLVRPGGRLVLFELDYGGTILPGAGHDPSVVRRAHATLERSAAQPWAGRRVPELLARRGVVDLEAVPYSFAVDERVWSRIVRDTLLASADAERDGLTRWLDDQPRGGFYAAFTGILTTGRVTPRPAASSSNDSTPSHATRNP